MTPNVDIATVSAGFVVLALTTLALLLVIVPWRRRTVVSNGRAMIAGPIFVGLSICLAFIYVAVFLWLAGLVPPMGLP